MIGVKIMSSYLKLCKNGMHYELADQMVHWLNLHVGLGSCKGGWSPDCVWMWTYISTDFRGAVVVFTDPDAAMLFKLTWGGE